MTLCKQIKIWETSKTSLQFLEGEFAKNQTINKKFSKWEHELNDKVKSGKMVWIKLFEMIKKTPIDWNTIWIVNSIATYTLNNNTENFEYSLNKAIECGVIKKYEKKDKGYLIMDKDKTPIRFLTLTDFIPDLDEKTKKRLESEERFGHCHWDSIQLSEHIDSPNKVVSGYCTTQSKNMPYTHSWVEVEHQGKEWVLDFTMNEAMEKQGYYKLYNPQNIVEIDNITLSEDIKLMKNTTLADKDIRMYLYYPDEAREVMQEEIKNRKTYQTGEFPWILIEK